MRRTMIAGGLGGLTGLVLGVGTITLAAARVVGGGLGAIQGPTGPEAAFLVERGALSLLVLVAGAGGGALIGMVTYALRHEADPDAPRFAMAPLTLLGAGTGAVVAFAVNRAAVGAAATAVVGGTVSMTVFRALIVAVVTGVATGAIVAVTVERLSHPGLLRLEGEAWPSNTAAFLREAITAVGIPAAGIAVAALLIFGFSRLLLEAEEIAALVAFAGAAALVLFGAAAVAAMPTRKSLRPPAAEEDSGGD